MDTEDFTAINETNEDRHVSRRQLAQQAITLAMQSRWQEAVDMNQRIVQQIEDPEAYNRMGKAYTELGQVDEARAAYEKALGADPANLIAQRNLDRLSRITDREAAELAKKAGAKLDPRFFMEETGKTGLAALQSPADAGVLATVVAGDQVRLQAEDGHLQVQSMDGVYLGQLDDRLSARLTRLIKTGNEYQAGVVGVEGSMVRIIIRETKQSAENAGRTSFPPQSQDTLPRPYVREGLLRRAGDEEDEDEADVDLTDTDVDEDDDDAREFGFHESGPDDA